MVSNYGIKSTAFAKTSFQVSAMFNRKLPCAKMLYEWLLQRMPAGKAQEVELEDFCNEHNYSLRHVRRAIDVLIDLDLIDLIKRYTWKLLKVVARLPVSSPSEIVPLMSLIVPDTSKTQPSNPLSSLHITEKIETNRPDGFVTSDFVSQDEEKESDRTLPQAQPIQPEPLVNEVAIGEDHFSAAAAKIESAIGKPIPPALRKLALEASLQVIEDAIASLQEAKAREKGVQDDVAYLVSAIRGEYKPRQPKAIVGSSLKTFGEWFDWAKLQGIVSASMRSGDGIDVMIGNGWVKFEDAIAQFPMV